MSKQNSLKDYLVDLYEGIVSKKPDASKNPQDFRSEIEKLSKPLEILSESEMNALLATAKVGTIYKYMGTTTDTYEYGAWYVVEESE